MERILCPNGDMRWRGTPPGIIGTIELFYKDIPNHLLELAAACGW
jgi:hypothetical protein